MEPTSGESSQGSSPAPADAKAYPADGGPSDGTLVRQTLSGKRAAFDLLIVRYQKQSVAVSYRLLGNIHDALEVTQDAFLKGFTNLSTLQKPEAFGGWLLRIVSNLSLNYRRSRKSRSQMPLDELLAASDDAMLASPAAAGDPVRRLAGSELGRRLEKALKQLPERQRLAILLFTIDELPQRQVAEALDCSVEAVKWHVFQGRKKLRELLKDVI